MSKSLAKKRAARKERGAFAKVREKTNGYDRTRSVQLVRVPYERPMSTMLVRRKVVYLVRIENLGWGRVPDLDEPAESCVLRAWFSNGKIYDKTVYVLYKKGEREKILASVFNPAASEADVLAAQSVLLRRKKAEQNARGAIERYFRLSNRKRHTCILQDPADEAA